MKVLNFDLYIDIIYILERFLIKHDIIASALMYAVYLQVLDDRATTIVTQIMGVSIGGIL